MLIQSWTHRATLDDKNRARHDVQQVPDAQLASLALRGTGGGRRRLVTFGDLCHLRRLWESCCTTPFGRTAEQLKEGIDSPMFVGDDKEAECEHRPVTHDSVLAEFDQV